MFSANRVQYNRIVHQAARESGPSPFHASQTAGLCIGDRITPRLLKVPMEPTYLCRGWPTSPARLCQCFLALPAVCWRATNVITSRTRCFPTIRALSHVFPILTEPITRLVLQGF